MTPHDVPADLGACARLPNWRQDFAWPIPPILLAQALPRALGGTIAKQGTLPPLERRALDLAVSQTFNVSAAALEAAFCLQQERVTGLRTTGLDPEWDYLRGETTTLPPCRALAGLERVQVPRLPLRRSAQVTAWWTPWWHVPRTLAQPEVIAIGENHLLAESARRSTRRIAFHHSGVFLKAARRRTARHDIDVGSLARTIGQCIIDALPLQDPWRQRLEGLLVSNAEQVLAIIAQDIASFGTLPHVPHRVWGANGSYYASRALGHEVMARGGDVTRFDHGGTLGMMIRPEDAAVAELLTCTAFVMNSSKLAENLKTTGALDLLPQGQRPEVIGGPGDASIFRLPLRARPPKARRRVVYCSTIYTGFSRYSYGGQPDPMVLDWSLRVAECLARLPIDLLCKPHPEGVLRGKRHPLADVAPVSMRRFEEEMAEADTFVFDRYHSTTFWLALCTDRPVIYLDAIPCRFHPSVEPMLRRRCIVIPVRWDERNRPVFESAALAEAVLSSSDRPDPSGFLELLAGVSVH